MSELDDKSMIQTESLWPGETLCLKKMLKEGEQQKGIFPYSAYGVITQGRPPYDVYLRPEFGKVERYNSVEELLAAGWIVD